MNYRQSPEFPLSTRVALGLLGIAIAAGACTRSYRSETVPTAAYLATGIPSGTPAEVTPPAPFVPTETLASTRTLIATLTSFFTATPELRSLTLTAAETLASTFTPLPPASATPFPIDQFISRRADGSPISIDERDAWGSLPNFDTDGDDQISDAELAPAAVLLNLWTDNLRQAYTTGVLGDQTVTTYEKLAEAHGFVAENFNLDFNWHPIDGFGQFSDELEVNGALGIATTADRLSETMVRLSEELAELGRQKNPGGEVKTPDQIYQGITANLNLEGKWQPGIDPEKVDEIRRQCFTFRREEGDRRQDQPEVVERAAWDQELRLGVEIKLGQEWVDVQGIGHFSNDGLIAVVVTVVPAAQLDNIKEILAQQNHQVTFTEISDGWWAVTMEFDMSERSHSPEDAVEQDQVRGSGGQLIECGPGAVPAPEVSRTPAPPPVTPAETPKPGDTPRPGETPRPSETPKPPATPTPGPPTITLRPPTATEVQPIPPTPTPPATPTPRPSTETSRPTDALTLPPTATLGFTSTYQPPEPTTPPPATPVFSATPENTNTPRPPWTEIPTYEATLTPQQFTPTPWPTPGALLSKIINFLQRFNH